MRWLAVLVLLLPQPVFAAWFKASSEHFIVYGEGTAESVESYADKLEKFEAVLSQQTGLRTEPGANRLIVFLVETTAAVQRQMDTKSRNVAGFYSPRLWGTIAVVPRRAGGGEFELNSQIVLFHEYTHHFMLQNAPAAYPAWYTEGFAEYFSTVVFKPDGSVQVGYPAKHRAYGLILLPPFPVQRLLVPDARILDPDQTEAFYGWSWLMTHYLSLSPARKGQLTTYLNAFADGASPSDAATAFGPLKDLQKDLIAYRDARRISVIQLNNFKPPEAKIEVQALTASQGASMPLFMRSYRASNGKADVEAIVGEARKLAIRFPSEPMALDVLAEFELDAEQYDAAQRANDAVIAARPGDPRALMRAARIAEARIDGKGDTAQWKAVRSLIVRANRAAPNDPFPLFAFYRWHQQSGTPVSKIAIDGLRRALALAPQVEGIRFTLASELIRDGKRDDARKILAPMINDPHSAETRESARKMLEGNGNTPIPAINEKDAEKQTPPSN